MFTIGETLHFFGKWSRKNHTGLKRPLDILYDVDELATLTLYEPPEDKHSSLWEEGSFSFTAHLLREAGVPPGKIVRESHPEGCAPAGRALNVSVARSILPERVQEAIPEDQVLWGEVTGMVILDYVWNLDDWYQDRLANVNDGGPEYENLIRVLEKECADPMPAEYNSQEPTGRLLNLLEDCCVDDTTEQQADHI